MNEELKEEAVKLQSFLDDFHGFVCKIIPTTKKWKEAIWDENIYMSLEECIRINSQYPSKLYFSPNGNYINLNKEGKKIKLQAGNPWSWCWLNAIVLDFNNINDDPDFLNNIKKKVSTFTILKWKYIIKTPHGYHFYFVINKEDRIVLFEKFNYWILNITKALWQFLWADVSVKNIWINSIFRLPYSFDWDVDKKNKIQILEATNNYVSKDQILDCINYLNQIKTREAAIKTWMIKERVLMSKISEKNIQGIFVFCRKRLNNINPIFFQNKIYSIFGKDIFENPCWDCVQFLYCVYKWDLNELLKDKNDLLVLTWNNDDVTFDIYTDADESLIETKHIIKQWVYELNFGESYVTLTTEKWKTGSSLNIILGKLEILWKWKQTVWVLWTECTIEDYVYIIRYEWIEKLMYTSTSKKEFTKMNWIFFYWSDNQVWVFFHLLANDSTIKEVDILQRSWYFWDVCVLWNTIVQSNSLSDYKVLLWDFAFKLCDEKQQVTVKEAFSFVRELYKDELIIPLFCSVLALCWMNLWECHEIAPAVLLSWLTGSGKSTLANILRQICWYSEEARRMTFRSLTPQPLKIAASDNAILCLEELTNITSESEQLIRNIVNRDITSRWALDTNYTWKLRSPLLVVWERTFVDESLNNRFATFIMSENYWNWDSKDTIDNIRNSTAYNDIYSTFMGCKDSINTLATKHKERLVEQDFSGRTADVWSYCLTMNDIFNLWIDKEVLLWYIRKHVERVWLDKKTKSLINCTMQFINYIRLSIQRKKLSFILDVVEAHWWEEFTLICDFLNEDTYQTDRWLLYSLLQEVNSELWEDVATLNKDWFIFKTVYMWNKIESKADKYIAQLVNSIARQISKKILSDYGMMQLWIVNSWIDRVLVS